MAPMSSRERVLAAIRRQPVDHLPCVGFFNPLLPAQRQGYTWNFPWRPDATVAQQVAYQAEVLGIDPLVTIGVTATAPQGECPARVWHDGDVLHKSYATPAGELHAAVRSNELWPHGEDIPFFSDFNVGHFVEPWLQSGADLACWRCLQQPRALDEIVATARAQTADLFDLASELGLATMALAGMGLTGAMHLFGASELCLLTIEQPELVDAYLQAEHELNLLQIAALGELGVDIVRRNGFYETADFYSPATLQQFLKARLDAEARAVRQAGMVSAYTVHTGVMPVLDHLAGLELDSLMGIDPAVDGVDFDQVWERLAPTKALWTGPSSTYHIWQGPAATRQATRQMLDRYGPTGLILSQCVSSHSIMPWESTLAMVDEWRRSW
ncbi:MAG: hypothetical protein IT204_06125 [Fimbriimonadaceae bacterium]|nr:hypothetical protein [Fimbriimonadaceae bacterium]